MREEKNNVLQSRGRDRGEEPCEVLAGGLAEEITALNGKKKKCLYSSWRQKKLVTGHIHIW